MIESFWRSSGNLSATSQSRYCACPNTFRTALEGKYCKRFLANGLCDPQRSFWALSALCVTKASGVSYVNIRILGYDLAWTDATPPLTAASGIPSVTSSFVRDLS
jgi:hypothetical protein